MQTRLIVCAGLALLFASWTYTEASTAATAPANGVARVTLPNGMRVVAVRDTLAPVVTTEMNYLVGSQDDPSGFPGMAHAQEHMMFRGSAGVSGAQLASIA